MGDIVTAAVITVSGMVGVGVISAIVQLAITKRVVDSEHRKVMVQVREESMARAREKRIEMLHEVIANFITLIDPDISRDIDIGRMTYLIHKAELLIDLRVEQEKTLNAILTRVGVLIAGYTGAAGVKEWLDPENKAKVLKMIGQISDQARIVFAHQNNR
jgi:hypothetical protein